MDRDAIADQIFSLIGHKLQAFGIRESEVDNAFDLVRSGLLDSMSFIDLVAGLEERFGVEIDLGKAAEDDAFTTFGGLVDIMNNTSKNE